LKSRTASGGACLISANINGRQSEQATNLQRGWCCSRILRVKRFDQELPSRSRPKPVTTSLGKKAEKSALQE
jgi:hypothetical protein